MKREHSKVKKTTFVELHFETGEGNNKIKFVKYTAYIGI